MSLDRYRCSYCDNPVGHSGEICGPCQAVHCTTEALEVKRAIRIGETNVVKAAMVRAALNAIAEASLQPTRHALKYLADIAEDDTLVTLQRMLK
jgi:hypothetical protein